MIVAVDRGLHDRGSFAKGLKANGVHIRQAAVEAPEQIGRGERHGGVAKDLMKKIIKAHHVVGKKQMKQAASVAMVTKNDSMRRDGFAPSQWVIGKFPRRPGMQGEEAEWGQLGVLQHQQDSATQFGLLAQMRLTAQKAFVKLDCGRRYAAAMLRAARPILGEYNPGDWVMYKVMQGADAPGSEWEGPARVGGRDGDVIWLQHGAVPVAASLRNLRPATTAEMLAAQVLARNRTPLMTEPCVAEGEQDGYLDARLPEEPEHRVPQIIPAPAVPAAPTLPALVPQIEAPSSAEQVKQEIEEQEDAITKATEATA